MMKHPYYDYTLDDALRLARSLKYGLDLKSTDPLPDIPEAIEIVRKEFKTIKFNWITGHAALQVLRSANGEEVEWF